MKKVIKKLVTLGTVLCLTFSFTMTAFAGQWQKDPEFGTLQWYQRDDGTYPVDCWETIDGKSYHFDVFGYLETDTVTSDGYTVDVNGAWIESIPQKTQEEMKQDTIAELISWYEDGIFESQEAFEKYASLFLETYCEPSETANIINDIRSNHTFMSDEEWNRVNGL